MDIEALRSKNIKRNQDLLRQLDLDSLHDSISRDARSADNLRRKKAKRAPLKATERVIPTRRSSRLANTPESQEENRLQEDKAEKERLHQERLRQLRSRRLSGEYQLDYLVADLRLGNLIYEDKVLDIPASVKSAETVVPSSEVEEIKEDAYKSDIKPEESSEEFVEYASVLETLEKMGSKYEVPDENDKKCKRIQDLKEMRDSLLQVKLSHKADPKSFKLTHNRITSIYLHLSPTDRIVAAGDTNGNLGLWAIDAAHDGDPVLAFFKPHGRTLSRILEVTNKAQQLITVSYDGSCRILDLAKLLSSEVFAIGEAEDPIGASDFNVVNDHLVFVTTLDGKFFIKDLRDRLKKLKFLRLHDKKIGGFCVNPNAEHQLATASLDRSMRIWDLRNISHKNSFSEFDGYLEAPHLYGSFPSRLSISTVDWNQNNHLVCNGYDDKIQLFDFSSKHDKSDVITRWSDDFRPLVKKLSGNVPENLKSFKTIAHNCQSGRWVSILKARWQKLPIDGFQKFAIANMKRGIDIFSENGDRLVNLTDADEMTTVPAVIAFHPTQNWIVGGSSSGKVFLFE